MEDGRKLSRRVGEKQALEDPRDLTEKTTAEIGFYKHLVLQL